MKLLYCLGFALMLLQHPGAQAESYSCVAFDYPPLMQKGQNGQPEGFAVELVTQVFRHLGHAVTIHF